MERCMRCGKEVTKEDVFVYVGLNHTSEPLGFQVTISQVYKPESETNFKMCIQCLKDYLTDNGLKENQINGIVDAYQNQVKEIDGEYVVD